VSAEQEIVKILIPDEKNHYRKGNGFIREVMTLTESVWEIMN